MMFNVQQSGGFVLFFHTYLVLTMGCSRNGETIRDCMMANATVDNKIISVSFITLKMRVIT